MQPTLVWASPLLVVAALAAQQAPPDTRPPQPATAAERMAALQAEQQKAVVEWQQQMQDAQQKAKAAGPGKAMPAMAMRPDFGKVVEQAKAAAADFAGTADAPQFLVFVVQMTSKPEDRIAALDTLTEKHLDAPALAQLGRMMAVLPRVTSPEKAKVYCERLAKSGNADVRGWVALARYQETIEGADVAGEAYRTAKAALQEAAAAATDEALTSEIQSVIDTREKFSLGKVAPDIEGQDLDGVAFKLSDYQGKVVFLDFWGDW